MSVKIMMGVLRELENTPSTTHKEQLLKAAGENIPNFKTMLVYALDPYKKYGLIALPNPGAGPGNIVPDWADIQGLLDSAASRKLTGAALKDAVVQKLGVWGPSARLLFKRVLLKDLRCGVGATLVNNVFPKLIPQFGIMLANTLQVLHIAKIKKSRGAWHQAKKNGHRLVAMIPPRYGPNTGESKAMSRKGHELHNYTGILRKLEFVVDQESEYRRDGLVFDGEVISGNFFSTSEVKKLAGNEDVNAVFHCFDMVTLPQWTKNTSELYNIRRLQLARVSNNSAWQMSRNLVHVPAATIRLDTFSMDVADSLRDQYEHQGDEGLIIRIDETYNYSTRSSLYKHKSMETMDCMIMEVLNGEDDKKYANTAGKVRVRLDDGETLCNAGLKLSDAERDEMWKNRNEYAGQMCEVAYQDKTISKTGAPKLQFPVFQRLRKDLS